MPSKVLKKSAKPASAAPIRPAASRRGSDTAELTKHHVAFFPLLTLTFIVWMMYRALFGGNNIDGEGGFPIWFDELIGKAVFFGLPVWLYISLTRSKSIVETFSLQKLKPGLLLGIAVGGILGFTATIATLARKNVIFQTAPLFSSDVFWWEFFLAIVTGFWESLFFFCWVMIVIMEKYRKWSLLNQVLLVSFIFILFHIPNTIIMNNYQIGPSLSMAFLLFFFAVGQSLLFARWRNLYSLVLSHAIWGMVLYLHAG